QQPGLFYLFGIVGVVFSRSGKRLGDFAAGTMVVQERAVRMDVVPVSVGEAEPGETILPRLPDDLVALMERYVARAAQLEPERRRALANRLIARVSDALPHEPVATEADMLRELSRERHARTGGM